MITRLFDGVRNLNITKCIRSPEDVVTEFSQAFVFAQEQEGGTGIPNRNNCKSKEI